MNTEQQKPFTPNEFRSYVRVITWLVFLLVLGGIGWTVYAVQRHRESVKAQQKEAKYQEEKALYDSWNFQKTMQGSGIETISDDFREREIAKIDAIMKALAVSPDRFRRLALDDLQSTANVWGHVPEIASLARQRIKEIEATSATPTP